VLAAAFLFNLGQGILRPSLPLYLQQFFGATYQMVTLIPVVFGAGKWIASVPTGYLMEQFGRTRLMVIGLVVIAACDLASVVAPVYIAFLGVRAIAGVGWAMFGTIATTTMVDRPEAQRGRAISVLLISETFGLMLGSTGGGWLYQRVGMASPFISEVACMLVAAAAVGVSGSRLPARRPVSLAATRDWRCVRDLIRTPGVLLMAVTNATLTAVHAGVLVFLFPFYLVERGRLAPELVGYMVGLSVLGRLAALWFAGTVSTHRNRLLVLSLGLVGFGVALGTLTLVTDTLLLALWSVMIGAAAGIVAGLPTAIIGDRVAPALQGIAIGWLRTVTDTGLLLGPLVLGVLADAIYLTAPFLCAAVLMCLLAWGCHRQAFPSLARAS
jgi:MFS family permease